MHKPTSLKFHNYAGSKFLPGNDSDQANYIRQYLTDLGVKSYIEEAGFFDRDYLAEFSEFYSYSSIGHANVCKRYHFFSTIVDRNLFKKALSGDENDSHVNLKKNYRGFLILRPISTAPFGKTVFSWYPDTQNKNPRVAEPSRQYNVNLLGIDFSVFGLAWQQQDQGVAACATVALWSMLQSSAFDDNHAIPVTTEITKAAHSKDSYGSRVFPASNGLSKPQMCEAIKQLNLSPSILDGEKLDPASGLNFFSMERFSHGCAAFIRSGYPVLIGGQFINSAGEFIGGHAVCAVGLRENPPSLPAKNTVVQHGQIHHLYVHDDNLGPSVRFSLYQDAKNKTVLMKPDKPSKSTGKDLFDEYHYFAPQFIVAAVHNELRTDPDKLYINGQILAKQISHVLKSVEFDYGVTFSARFVKTSSYFSKDLAIGKSGVDKRLAQVRLQLKEKCRPMPDHIGLIRIGCGPFNLADILYDTSDSSLLPLANIASSNLGRTLIDQTSKIFVTPKFDVGVNIDFF